MLEQCGRLHLLTETEDKVRDYTPSIDRRPARRAL
jgi:hypothetical protein